MYLGPVDCSDSKGSITLNLIVDHLHVELNIGANDVYMAFATTLLILLVMRLILVTV